MSNPAFQSFKKHITHPVRFRLFLLSQLPSAFFAGLRVTALSADSASVIVRQKWFNKNPFRCIYLGILTIAAEVSTGIICMGALYKRKPAISMLLIKSDGAFYKKATGKIVFTCSSGPAVNEAVDKCIVSGEGETVTCHSKGVNENNELVAEFNFTWSFKARK